MVGSGSVSVEAGFERNFETTFETSSAYRDKLVNQKVEEKLIEHVIVFEQDSSWVIVSWGGKVQGFGGYTVRRLSLKDRFAISFPYFRIIFLAQVLFREYGPNKATQIVDESATITTSDIATDTVR